MCLCVVPQRGDNSSSVKPTSLITSAKRRLVVVVMIMTMVMGDGDDDDDAEGDDTITLIILM